MAQKIVWGCVNADGTKESGGGGYSIDKDGTGRYFIHFNESFTKTPSVVTDICVGNWDDFGSDGGTTKNSMLLGVDKGKFKVKTGASDGSSKNRNFTFLAIGEVSG